MTYGLDLSGLLLDVFDALPFERRLYVLRSVLGSCFFNEMGFSERCWSRWESFCRDLGVVHKLFDLAFCRELDEKFRVMLVPHVELYLSLVPLLELSTGLYIGPGVACLEIELDDISRGSVIEAHSLFLEKLVSVDLSKLYRLILAIVEMPREDIEASYSALFIRNPMLQELVVETFDVTSISVLCRDGYDVYIYTELLENPPIDIELDFLGRAKKCDPTDLIQFLNFIDLYVAISSRHTISSLARVLDLLGSAESKEISECDLDKVENLIGRLHDVMLLSRLRLVDVRELKDFLLGKTSRCSELVEELARFPNKNLDRCITRIATLNKPRFRKDMTKIFKEACGYRRTLRNLETALKALIEFLNNTYSELYATLTIRGLRKQIEAMNEQIEMMSKQIKAMNKQIILAYIMIVLTAIAVIISALQTFLK